MVSYVNVFVAQYVGAGASERVGASLWQGIYFSLIAGLFLASLCLIAEPLFRFAGHHPAVMRLEVVYFRILTLGAGAVVLATTLSCFFSGRGLTRPVMLINLVGAGLNIPLDYLLINGVGFFPELGIVGAALATVASQVLVMILFALAVFTRRNDRRFAVLRSWAWDGDLMRRMLRYGLPGGVQFFLDILVFTFFVFMIGRLGRTELAATNIVMAINTLSFMPMIGMSVAVSTLLGPGHRRGQALGRACGPPPAPCTSPWPTWAWWPWPFCFCRGNCSAFLNQSTLPPRPRPACWNWGWSFCALWRSTPYSMPWPWSTWEPSRERGTSSLLCGPWPLACLGMVITPHAAWRGGVGLGIVLHLGMRHLLRGGVGRGVPLALWTGAMAKDAGYRSRAARPR